MLKSEHGKRAESIYRKPEQLSAEHAGGNEVILSTRESKLADLKMRRADEDMKQAESLRIEIASAGEEIEVKEEDVIDTQEIPSGKTKTSEQGPEASGEIINKDILPKPARKEFNKNVISRDLYRAAKYNDFKVAEETNIAKAENDRQRAKELRTEEAQRAYVRAYREYDPKFTKNKADDLIAVTRPPWLAFGRAAKELKRLYGVMVEARKKMAGEEEAIQETLAENKRKLKDNKTGLSPEAQKNAEESNERDELAELLKGKKIADEVDKLLG